MNRAFRILKLIFLITGLLLLIAIPVSGLISTAVNWHGSCEKGAQEPGPCSWGEYALQEMFWSIFIFIPFLFLATLLLLGLSIIQFITSLVKKHRQKLITPKS